MAASLALAAKCPDPRLRSATIGGNEIDAGLLLPGSQSAALNVRLYRGGKLVWQGTSDKEGRFKIEHLAPGRYELVVDKWGKTTITLDPRKDAELGGQQANWSLTLENHNCISSGMSSD